MMARGAMPPKPSFFLYIEIPIVTSSHRHATHTDKAGNPRQCWLSPETAVCRCGRKRCRSCMSRRQKALFRALTAAKQTSPAGARYSQVRRAPVHFLCPVGGSALGRCLVLGLLGRAPWLCCVLARCGSLAGVPGDFRAHWRAAWLFLSPCPATPRA